MGFNVSGQEVATGVQDPMIMFQAFAVIICIGIVAFGLYALYQALNK
jgi:hypothetical protein